MNDFASFSIVMALLLGLSMFFSINATAFRIHSRLRLQEAFKKLRLKDRSEDIAQNAHELAAICAFYRLSINFAVLLVTLVYLSGNAAVQVHNLVLSFVIAIILLSIFSLAIPYAMAKYVGEEVLARMYLVVQVFAFPAYPVRLVIRLYDTIIRRLAGVQETSDEEEREEKEEEFLNVVEQGKIEGIVDQEQQEMIEGVLELNETTAEQIMTPRTDIVAVSADAGLQGVLDAVATGHSRIPVYEGTIDNIVGFIYAKDILAEIGKSPAEFKVHQRMRAAYFVPETKPLRILLHEFQTQKLHVAIVLDEYGGTAGLVTIEDILEELVGEIADEYEEAPEQPVKRIDENTIEADARIRIDEFNAEFEVELPDEEDYDTLGGFVFSHLGYIPKTGETFEWNNLKFVISSAEIRKINRIRVERIPQGSRR